MLKAIECWRPATIAYMAPGQNLTTTWRQRSVCLSATSDRLINMPDELLVSQPTLIGVLMVAVSVLAGVVVYLYRDGRRLQRQVNKERAEWKVERAGLAGDFEQKLRLAAEDYANEVVRLGDTHAEREKQTRHEFTEVVEQISAEAEKSADVIRAVLQKFLDRFIGPRMR